MNANELKEAFANLPLMSEPEISHNWEYRRWCLRQDVAGKEPPEFLTWPTVVGTMFVGNAAYIEYEQEALPCYLAHLIDETKFGKPELLGSTSGNLIHQAYHIAQWGDPISVSRIETIVEIGGGYGAMALICHRLGFRGQYIIYDLPEFSLLQQYYLSNVGVNNVEFATKLPDHIVCDLLIGLYSLSEIPLSLRADVLRAYPSESYLFAYQAGWGGNDNIAWAADMMQNDSYIWQNWNVKHLPNSWYLVGSKR
jgi:hypothetical protein